MNIEYIYDKKTKALIDRFKKYLADYEDMLINKINNQTDFGCMSGFDVQSSKRHAFLNDKNRIELEKQLTKVYAQAIPDKIIFSDKANTDS